MKLRDLLDNAVGADLRPRGRTPVLSRQAPDMGNLGDPEAPTGTAGDGRERPRQADAPMNDGQIVRWELSP